MKSFTNENCSNIKETKINETLTKTQKYKKSKMFKSELKLYYVEVEIFKYYSCDQAKLIIYLFDDNKKVLLEKEEFRISNHYKHTDLDNCAKKVINKFEDWRDMLF